VESKLESVQTTLPTTRATRLMMQPTTRKRTISILGWLAVSLVIAVFCGWLISAHLAPRSFASAFWPCLAGIVAGSLVFVLYNGIEAGFIGCMFLALALVCIPIARRVHKPALPYLLAAAVLGGFTSSRFLRGAL
jgi:hypothetical protein